MGSVIGQEQFIVSRYEVGDSAAQIARTLEVPTTSVSRVLERSGIRHRRKAFKFSEEQEREITERYKTGELSSKIASDIGIHPVTVRAIARRNGLPINPRGQQYRRLSEEELRELERRWLAGESQYSIAVSLGCHQSRVSNLLRDRGLTPEQRLMRAESHVNWKGGRALTGQGYVSLWLDPDDPLVSMRTQNGRVLEHRLVMARSLGRPLHEDETVHHINGDRLDNRLENLQLRQGWHGKGERYVCLDCGSHNVQAVPLHPQPDPLGGHLPG
jgi:hypothetical protein